MERYFQNLKRRQIQTLTHRGALWDGHQTLLVHRLLVTDTSDLALAKAWGSDELAVSFPLDDWMRSSDSSIPSGGHWLHS